MAKTTDLKALAAKLGWSQRLVTKLSELPSVEEPWSEEELATLRRLFPDNTLTEIARQMKTRTWMAIKTRAKLLGLRKNKPNRSGLLMTAPQRRRRRFEKSFDQDDAA